MIKIIVHAFINSGKIGVVEVLFATSDDKLLMTKMSEFQRHYPGDYLAIYDLPLDTDLNKLSHYPSVAISKEDFHEEKANKTNENS